VQASKKDIPSEMGSCQLVTENKQREVAYELMMMDEDI
jgi:hypothetical protein